MLKPKKTDRRYVRLLVKADNLAMTIQRLEDRPHAVVPATILVEGVHCGTGGCFLYRAADIAETAELWDNTPIIIHHPGFNLAGELVDPDNVDSARQPRILNERGVGRIFNTRFDPDGGKLRVELWMDQDRLAGLSPAAAEEIRSGHLEVSTGLYFNITGDAGEWNGERYEGAATMLIPDHLALLPNGRGACSFDDGCGVRSNTQGSDAMANDAKKPGLRITMAIDTDGDCADKASIGTRMIWALMRSLKSRLDHRPIEWHVSDGVLADLGTNALSHEELRSAIQRAVDGLDRAGWLHFVRAVYDDNVIYEARIDSPTGATSKLYRVGYSVNADGAVALGNDPIEVRMEVRYVPVSTSTDNADPAPTGEENRTMEKIKGLVDGLIANTATAFEEADRDWLSGLKECQLEKLTVAKAPAPDPAATSKSTTTSDSAAPAPATPAKGPDSAPGATPDPAPSPTQNVAAYIELAPPELRGPLKGMLVQYNARKDALIAAITANDANTFTAEQLGAKDHDELEQLAKLAKVDVPEPLADYSGRGGSTRQDGDEIPPPTPVWDLTKMPEPEKKATA